MYLNGETVDNGFMKTWNEYKKTMESPDTLLKAAKENRVQKVEELLAQGAEINAVDHRGYSALMLAAYSDSEEAVHLLLSHGADPNTADLGGNSVLMGVSFKGNLKLANWLIEAGADPSRKNSSGMTAYDFAVAFGRTEIAERLASHIHGSSQEPQRKSRACAIAKLVYGLITAPIRSRA